MEEVLFHRWLSSSAIQEPWSVQEVVPALAHTEPAPRKKMMIPGAPDKNLQSYGDEICQISTGATVSMPTHQSDHVSRPAGVSTRNPVI